MGKCRGRREVVAMELGAVVLEESACLFLLVSTVHVALGRPGVSVTKPSCLQTHFSLRDSPESAVSMLVPSAQFPRSLSRSHSLDKY